MLDVHPPSWGFGQFIEPQRLLCKGSDGSAAGHLGAKDNPQAKRQSKRADFHCAGTFG
jgi:hypothetical protein